MRLLALKAVYAFAFNLYHTAPNILDEISYEERVKVFIALDEIREMTVNYNDNLFYEIEMAPRVVLDAWKVHLNYCDICRKAIRGRFASATFLQMYNNCCDKGKPLYKDFCHKNQEKE